MNAAVTPDRILLVPYRHGAAGPLEIAQAATGLCRPVFVVDPADGHVVAIRPILSGLAEVVEWRDLDDWLARLVGTGEPSAVTTFSEDCMAETAVLAERLGLSYHGRDTIRGLTDKAEQRAVLNAAAVSSVRQSVVTGTADFATALDGLQFPVVVKPARSSGSRQTYRCDDAAEYRKTVEHILTMPDAECWVIEELLPPGSHPAGSWLGDYVSVESLVQPGRISHLAITDKLPLAPPFREAGMVLPSALPAGLQADITDLTDRAIHALGITSGIVQTEVKLCPEGPVIIEVNGRLGGYIAALMRRSCGVDLVRLAVQAALGLDEEPPPVHHRRFAMQYFVMPPPERVKVVSIARAGIFRTAPEVSFAERVAQVGDILDWRRGTSDRLFNVLAEVTDHADVPRLLTELDSSASRCVVLEPMQAG